LSIVGTKISKFFNLQGMHPVVLSYKHSSFCFRLSTTTIRVSFAFHCV
jgi:hypothetical protein